MLEWVQEVVFDAKGLSGLSAVFHGVTRVLPGVVELAEGSEEGFMIAWDSGGCSVISLPLLLMLARRDRLASPQCFMG